MNDEAAFLAAIAADPKDELGYLVFADWLQEQGEEVRAGLVRDPKARAHLGPMLRDPYQSLRANLLASRDLVATKRRLQGCGAFAVPTLVEVLSAQVGRRVTVSVLECARAIGPAARPLLPAILPLLGDADSRIARKAAAAVRALGLDENQSEESVGPLIEALRSEDLAVSTAALATLDGRWIGSLVLPRIARDRLSHDPQARLRAVELLRGIPGTTPIAGAIRFVRDTDPGVRRAGAQLLVRATGFGSAEDRESMRLALADPDPAVVAACAQVLGCAGPLSRSVVPDLLECLPRLDGEHASHVLTAMGRIARSDPAVRYAFLERLEDPDPGRAAAAWPGIHGSVGYDPAFLSGVLRLVRIGDPGWDRERPVLSFLARVRPVPAGVADLVRQSLRDHDTENAACLHAVADLDRHAAELLPDLEARLLARSEPERGIGVVLARIEPEGLQALTRLLDAPDLSAGQLRQILEGLWQCRPRTEGILPRLRALLLLRGNEPGLGRAIGNAILAICPADLDLLTDLMPAPDQGIPWHSEGFARAFDEWLAAAEPFDRTPYRPEVCVNVLDALADVPIRPADHLPLLRAISALALELHRDLADRAVALRMIEGVLRVANRWTTDAASLAPQVVELLSRPEASLNRRILRDAVLVLGLLGDTSAVPALCPFLKHADRFVAGRTAYALRLLASPGAVGPLCDALSDPRPVLRFKAARALGVIGAVNPSVLDRLGSAARDDPDESVRRESARVLRRMLPKPPRKSRAAKTASPDRTQEPTT